MGSHILDPKSNNSTYTVFVVLYGISITFYKLSLLT